MGRIAINQNSLEAAHTYLIECVEIFQECSNTIELHAALSDLGLLAYLREDFSYARSCHEKSLAHFREAGNIAGLEMSLNRLGDIARCENNYKEAERLYMESLFIYHQTGDKDEIASLLHNLGYIAIHHGDGSDALDLYREALAMQIELDNKGGFAECLAGIAGVFVMQGQWERAATLFAAAEALREAAKAVSVTPVPQPTQFTISMPSDMVKMERMPTVVNVPAPVVTSRGAPVAGRGARRGPAPGAQNPMNALTLGSIFSGVQ